MECTVKKHIDVLDGIRAISILFVVWYHFWQQSWLTPYVTINSNMARYFGVSQINLAGFVRYGFIFVDLLILLSAVCNFFPYARAILLGEPWPDMKEFYLKRIIRIFPSYFLSVLIMLIIAIAEKSYADAGFMWKDIVTHLTFTGIFNSGTLNDTRLNVVLWTVQLEVIYYILLPWIALLFKKCPVLTLVGMWGCGIFSANYFAIQKTDNLVVYVNHILTFAGCYANGILLCMLYITLKKSRADNRYIKLAATVSAVFCVICFNHLLNHFGDGNLQEVQLKNRYAFAAVFAFFVLSVMFSMKGFQWIFANKIVRFISVISYNLYIWHQVIAVKCKEYRIPYWEGEEPPNITGDRIWQWKYQILIIVLSLLAAILLTYCFEIPVAKFFRRKMKQAKAVNRNNIEEFDERERQDEQEHM